MDADGARAVNIRQVNLGQVTSGDRFADHCEPAEWTLQVLAVQQPAAYREHHSDKNAVAPDGLPRVRDDLGHIQVGSIDGADFVFGISQNVLDRLLDRRRLGIDQVERVDQVVVEELRSRSARAIGFFGAGQLSVPNIELFDMVSHPQSARLVESHRRDVSLANKVR